MYIAHAVAVLLVDQHGLLHPVVASPLLEVPMAETSTDDCPLANRLDTCPGISWNRHQGRLLRPSSGQAATQRLHLAQHGPSQSSGQYVRRHCRQVNAAGRANILVMYYIPL